MKREIYYIPILPDTLEDKGLNPKGLIEIAEYRLYTQQEMKEYISSNHELLVKQRIERNNYCKIAIKEYDRLTTFVRNIPDGETVTITRDMPDYMLFDVLLYGQDDYCVEDDDGNYIKPDIILTNKRHVSLSLAECCIDSYETFIKLPPEHFCRFIAVERWVVDDEVKDALSRLGECCANVLELYEADKEFEENFNRITDAMIDDEEDY